MILRKATLHDLPAVQQVYEETIKVTCKGDYNEEQLDAWAAGAENQSRWTTAIEHQYFLVAYIDETMVGFGSLEDTCYIDFLFVRPAFQEKGVAKAIYNALETEARATGNSAITANVSKTARVFFEKQGFTVVRTNVNRVRGVEIENYHMKKSLG